MPKFNVLNRGGVTCVPNRVSEMIVAGLLSKSEIRVVMCIANVQGEGSCVAISYQEICDLTGMDRKAVRKSLSALMEKEVLASVQGSGRGKSVYKIES